MSRRNKLALAGVLLLALAIRIAYILEAQANPMHLAPQMDARYHLEWAQALLDGGEHHAGPFFRAPLYPWFLAGSLWISGGSLLSVLLIQALLGAATTWLTYSLARAAFPSSGPRGAVIAAALVACNWVLVYFDGELLLPTLGVPLQLLALRLSIPLNAQAKPLSALTAGLAWGLAALVRPNGLLFLALLCAWHLIRHPRRAIIALSLAAGAAMPILPVTAYNASQGDTVLVSSQAGINLWIGNNPDSDGSTAIVPGTRPDWWGGHRDAIRQAERAEQQPLAPSQVSRHYAGRTWDWIRSSPRSWLALMGSKLRLFLEHHELGNNANINFVAHHFSWTMRALPPSFAPLLGLGLAGMLLGWRRREIAGELPAFLLVYTLSVLAFFICARYRAPLLPILACGAGHSLSWLHAALSERRIKGAAQLAALALCISCASVFPSYNKLDDGAAGFWQLGVAAHQLGDIHEADARAADDEGARPLRKQAKEAYSTAVHYHERAIGLEDRYWYAWRDLGNAHLAQGDLKSAERALKRGLSIRPREPWLSDLLANVLFQGRRADELEDLGNDLLVAHPAHPTAHYHLARAHYLRGDRHAAFARAQDGLQVDPDNYECLFLAAHLSRDVGQAELECERIQAAIRAAGQAHMQAELRLAEAEALRLGCAPR